MSTYRLGNQTVTHETWREAVKPLSAFEIDSADIIRHQVIDGDRTEWLLEYVPARWQFTKWLIENGRHSRG